MADSPEMYDTEFAIVPHQTNSEVVMSNVTRDRIDAPGMKTLTPEQTDQIESIFGHRFVVVQQNPDILSRADRRRLGHRTRMFGQGRMVVHKRWLPGGAYEHAHEEYR